MRKTKILATLGPSCASVEIMKELIKAGMDGARLNFSHGDYESHGEMMKMLKEARRDSGVPVPIVLDTKGPEIRLKTFAEGMVTLVAGKKFILTADDVTGDSERVSITHKGLPNDVKSGDKILLDDGLIELKVIAVQGPDIVCQVVNGGVIKDRKGVNLPDVYTSLPNLTQKDIDDIKFGVENNVDYIAASFIRCAQDVKDIREILDSLGGEEIKIIAKIENKDGIKNFEGILDASDGIMVARGDMGVELNPEEVPIVQKRLIKECNLKGKLVITATQMLESMINNPRPTRAEANDVANSILDGTDCIMLSGETAGGKYPVLAVGMMSRIATTTEEHINYYKKIGSHHYVEGKSGITDAIAYAACSISADVKSSCILTATNSGFTARMVSKFRPKCPIISLTADIKAFRQLNLVWGVRSIYCEDLIGEGDISKKLMDISREIGISDVGDTVVIVAGFPLGVAGSTNTINVKTIGDVFLMGANMTKTDNADFVKARACVVKDISEAQNFQNGDVLIVQNAGEEFMPYIKKSAAVIAGGSGGGFEYLISAGNQLKIPVIICEDDVTVKIPSGILITIDAKKGVIYNGIREVAPSKKMWS